MADVSKIKLPNNSVLDIRDNSKITDPSTKSSGQYLTYNGTSWVADDIPQTEVNTLSVDSAPTNGSSNLVTSGGVYTAISNVDALPSQTGQSGKFLTTNGTAASWTGISSSNVTTALGYTPANDSGVVHTTGNETISGTKTFNDTINQKSNLSMRFYGTNDSGRMQFRAQPSDNVIRGTVAITDGYSTAGSGYTGFVTQLVAREGNTSTEGFNTIRTSNKGPEYIKETNDGTVTVDKVIVDSSGKYTDTLMGTPTVASGDYLLIDDASAGTIEKGPAFGSETTKFLRNDGTWQVPPGTGGEPNVIDVVKVNGTALTVTDKAVDVPVPTSNSSATTGISIADHSTTTITGVSGSTSVTGVQSTTTTASKVTLGTAISVPNVTSAGSASNWAFENITVPIKDSSSKTIPNVTAAGSGSFTQGTFSGGSFTQGTDSFTANTPTAINTSKFSGGSFTRGSFSGGSFTRGAFSGGSLTITNDTTTDSNHHILTFAFSPATHANDTFTAATHANDSFTPASLASGFYTAGTAASFTQGVDSFTPATHGTDTHTHTPPTLGTAFTITGVQSTTTTASHVKSGGNGTAPTLGTAISIPNVTAATDVTVPIKDASATTVPTAATSATTVVTSKTHSVTDNGHTHTLAVPE